MGARIPMLEVLKYKAYTLLVGGHCISLIGSRLFTVCLMVYVYEVTGSALNVATMTMVFMIALFIARPLGGMFADRFNRKYLIALTYVLEGVLSLIVWIHPQLLLVYIINFLMGVCSATRSPAVHAVVPDLVPDDSLYAANATFNLTRRIAHIAGPSAAAAVIAFSGASAGFAVNAATYALAAVLVMYAAVPVIDRVVGPTGIVADFKLLWAFISQRPDMVICGVALAVHGFIVGMNNVLVYPFVFDYMHLDGAQVSMLITALACGLFVGSFLVGNFGKNLRPHLLIWFSLAGIGASFIAFGLTRILLVAMVTRVALGLFEAGFGLGTTTHLQKNAPRDIRGRALGTLRAGEDGLLILGMTAGGMISTVISVPSVFIGLGAISFVVAVVVWIQASRSQRLNAISD